MIKNTSEVKVYEQSGEEIHGLKHPTVLVLSHWNDPARVVLQVKDKDGKPMQPPFTVVARDLQVAIENATNTNRHG
jgi:hypothetical protein